MESAGLLVLAQGLQHQGQVVQAGRHTGVFLAVGLPPNRQGLLKEPAGFLVLAQGAQHLGQVVQAGRHSRVLLAVDLPANRQGLLMEPAGFLVLAQVLSVQPQKVPEPRGRRAFPRGPGQGLQVGPVGLPGRVRGPAFNLLFVPPRKGLGHPFGPGLQGLGAGVGLQPGQFGQQGVHLRARGFFGPGHQAVFGQPGQGRAQGPFLPGRVPGRGQQVQGDGMPGGQVAQVAEEFRGLGAFLLHPLQAQAQGRVQVRVVARGQARRGFPLQGGVPQGRAHPVQLLQIGGDGQAVAMEIGRGQFQGHGQTAQAFGQALQVRVGPGARGREPAAQEGPGLLGGEDREGPGPDVSGPGREPAREEHRQVQPAPGPEGRIQVLGRGDAVQHHQPGPVALPQGPHHGRAVVGLFGQHLHPGTTRPRAGLRPRSRGPRSRAGRGAPRARRRRSGQSGGRRPRPAGSCPRRRGRSRPRPGSPSVPGARGPGPGGPAPGR